MTDYYIWAKIARKELQTNAFSEFDISSVKN